MGLFSNIKTFIIVILCLPYSSFSQDCCDTDGKLVICYLPSDEYCSGDCRYHYDDIFMEGLRSKLNNTSYFGPDGISSCEVEEIPLRNISSVNQLNNLNCDIIFFGVANSQLTGSNSIFTTSLPMSFTDIVLEWSVECLENLVISFQGESTRWGYEILSDNVNPNTPAVATIPNIFNGIFGSIDEVNQGGSFQANFSAIPPTGSTILAQDNLGRPTIVLDNATNDILMADVGLVCNTAGDVSNSPLIMNSNDILVCNVFALGCDIAGNFASETAIICENSSYELPDGIIVNEEGEYSSVIVGSMGCDSTIITTVELYTPEPTTITYEGCASDGYEIEIGNNIYNESNPVGTEDLPGFLGCDSTVTIELIFRENSEGFFDTIICMEDSFLYLENNFTSQSDTTLIIPNAANCDSFVNVLVEIAEFMDVVIDERTIVIRNSEEFLFDLDIPNDYAISWTPSSGLSCTDCANPILNNIDDIPIYTLTLTSEKGCQSMYSFPISYICEPYIPNIFNPESINGNDRFGPLTSCELTDYTFIVYDRWGSVIFETKNQDNLWNGTKNKRDLDSGIFVYFCEYSNNGELIQQSGPLTLIR